MTKIVGEDIKHRLTYFEKKCVMCGSCVNESEFGGVKFSDGKIFFDTTKPEDWTSIMQICPTGAIIWNL